MKQVKFKDTDGDIHGGILLDDGSIVCGCCGGLIPVDEQLQEDGFELLEKYENWINLDEAIIGE